MKLEVIGSGSSEVLWPAPIEPIWNSIGQTNSLNRILKRPDIGLSHRLLIASIPNLPTSQRPRGIVTWLSDFYRTSRQTLYSIADSIIAPFQFQKWPDDQPALLVDDPSLLNERDTTEEHRGLITCPPRGTNNGMSRLKLVAI